MRPSTDHGARAFVATFLPPAIDDVAAAEAIGDGAVIRRWRCRVQRLTISDAACCAATLRSAPSLLSYSRTSKCSSASSPGE